MSPSAIIQDLNSLRERLPGDDQLPVDQAVELIQQLSEQVAMFRHMASQRFRPSSEKVDPGQLAMTFIAHLAQQAGKTEAGGTTPSPPKPSRPKRKSGVKALPVNVVDKTIPAQELRCECGKQKTDVGYDTKRQVIYQPPKLFMEEEREHKYECDDCKNGVCKAKGSPKLIEGSLASSSLLAHLTVGKCIDSTPIERIGKQLERHDAALAPSTLYDWFARAGDEVGELMPRIHSELLTSHLISLDDTPLPTKNLAHVNNIQRGRLWLFLGDVSRIAYCMFSEDWKGKHPQRILDGFQGEIQSDGYGGLAPLFQGHDPPKRAGCNDHSRRKFVDAMKLGDSRAQDIIELYAQLYVVERQATQAGASAETRLEMRQRISVPIWVMLQARIEALAQVCTKKGPLGKAVIYWTKQRETLALFLSNGHVPISNAHVERMLRTVALMRKNTLFIGSLDAGPRYAALLTMALNCTLCGANPFAYFTWLYDRLADGVRGSQVLDLMPQAWLRNQKVAD
jgi:transposase